MRFLARSYSAERGQDLFILTSVLALITHHRGQESEFLPTSALPPVGPADPGACPRDLLLHALPNRPPAELRRGLWWREGAKPDEHASVFRQRLELFSCAHVTGTRRRHEEPHVPWLPPGAPRLWFRQGSQTLPFDFTRGAKPLGPNPQAV